MTKYALISLFDTTNVEKYARALSDIGWKVIATSETVAILKENLIPCIDIAEFTGVSEDFGIPPTLHPKIENALTMDEAQDRIELVYDIPYPLETGNDVGGRTLLALAAKGNRLPIMSSDDMEKVLVELKNTGTIPDDLRQAFIDKANAEIAGHYLNLVQKSVSGSFAGVIGKHAYDLMNGENPYQKAAFFSVETSDSLALANFENLSATPPCFTNLADIDSVLTTLYLAAAAFQEQYGKQPYITVAAKHGNACGMAISWDNPLLCVEQALFGNPIAVWGGEVAANFFIDEELAMCLKRHARREALLGSAGWMLDVVIAPDYSAEAVEQLLKRKFRKVFRNPQLSSPQIDAGCSFRWVRGGFIRQSPAWRVLKLQETEKTAPQHDEADLDSLIIAWAAAFSSFHGGNEVALAKDRRLIAVGGDPSTIQAAESAVERARQGEHDTAGSVFCADAFFPFTDAPEALVDAGVKLGCVPAGGKNENLVREIFAENNVEMLYLPEDFRGFCRH